MLIVGNHYLLADAGCAIIPGKYYDYEAWTIFYYFAGR